MIRCRLFGHKEEVWYRNPESAYAQHNFIDGVQCGRCEKLLWTYDDKDNKGEPSECDRLRYKSKEMNND